MPSFVPPPRVPVSHFVDRSGPFLRNTCPNFYKIPAGHQANLEHSINSSEFLSNEKRVEAARSSLRALDNVEDGWDSYDSSAPNTRAINMAWRVLASLREEGLIPERVLPSAEGGVAFVFTGAGDNRAVIESLNQNEDFILLYDRSGNSRTLEWTGEFPKTLIASLRTHLRGSRLAAS